MNALVSLAKKLRHAPGLRQADGLWRVLRRPYQWLLNPLGRGVAIELGGRGIRLPTTVLSLHPDWSTYERDAFSALAQWLDRNPSKPQVLDIGSSFGIFATFVLQVSPRAELFALESDLVSLKAMDELVQNADRPRLHRIRALLGTEHKTEHTLAEAIAATTSALAMEDGSTALSRTRFVCLGDSSENSVPHYSVDALFSKSLTAGPVLLKCDVEGAELVVLHGARELLARSRPTLLLSVHPAALPKFNQTPDDVAQFLRQNGYRFEVLARDHEEHWWCEPV